MHMHKDQPTRLERKLSKELERETKREESTLYHHLKDLEKAQRHRQEAEHLRKQLAKLRIKEVRLEERIKEQELLAAKFDIEGGGETRDL